MRGVHRSYRERNIFMLGRWVALVALCLFSAGVFAESHQELLDNLRSRFKTLPGRGSLIQSFSHHKQSYIYDQALAIIAFTRSSDQKSARALLRALESVQLKDGSLYFSYNLDGTSPYPHEGDRRFAGAIAWVALAATHYQAQFFSKEFVPFNRKILSYLSSETLPYESLRFGPSDMKLTPWREDETAALEHNLDAYSAFTHFASLNPETDWTKEVKVLRKFILSMWDSNRSHFWSGLNLKTGKTNKEELYLDNQTWSLLALDEPALKDLNMREALALNCESLYVEHKGISGFVDSKPTNGMVRHQFVWSEGTLGQIMAMEKAGFSCENKNASELLTSIMKMKKEDGGIAYATKNVHPDFTTDSSVAGTAWMWFAVKGVNPFEVIRVPSGALQISRISHRDP